MFGYYLESKSNFQKKKLKILQVYAHQPATDDTPA